MESSSVTRVLLARADVRSWEWWKLPWAPRVYVALVPAAAAGFGGWALWYMTWTLPDFGKFLLLLGCGLISVRATPRIAYPQGVLVRDFISAWVLPIAVLLPPLYAVLAPAPLLAMTQMVVSKKVLYRKVFTVTSMGLAYGVASLIFRAFPASFAGSSIGAGKHAVTWAVAVLICEVVGGRGHNALIMAAIKISNPSARLREQEMSREALVGDLTEFNLGVLITIIVGVTPVFCIFAVLMWLMVRRFMMHSLLLAKSRIDTKTGLLNASTWESEASTEIARSVRACIPISIALIDIDHFKLVNDTYGHLAGDKVLKVMGDEIQNHLRQTDMAGRFGGEEFVVLLPNAREHDALAVAERLRAHIEATPIPIGDDPADGSQAVRLTISAGVAALTEDCHELTDLLAASDAALYYAKQHGRNRTHAINASEHKTKFTPAAEPAPS